MALESNFGDRISSLRKLKGFSQEELAKLIGISRPSLVQIEKGKRSLNVVELQKLAEVLHFSTDKFLAKDFEPEKVEIVGEIMEFETTKTRVSIPALKMEKMKNVLLYILEQCAGKPNVGETVLNKLLYFADFNYYELYEEQLTGATYKKLPYGPVPISLDLVIKSMTDEGLIQRIKTKYHGLDQKRLIPLEEPDLTKLRASEAEVIDSVIELYSNYSATDISDYSHKDLPWLASEFGEEIDYELAFYREAPYSVRKYD